MEYRLYYHDCTLDDQIGPPGVQMVLCKRLGKWQLLQAGDRFGNERWGYMALRRMDGSTEWHVVTEKGARQFKDLRPDVYLAYRAGLDCLDDEFADVRQRAEADLAKLRSE